MELDLRKVNIQWLTIEKNTDRHAKMKAMFDRLGFTRVNQINGPIVKPYTVGIAQTHIAGLIRGLNEPLLILEDDCQETKDFNPVINVPDSHVDAIYLGTSTYGQVHGTSYPGNYIVAEYDDDYIRVLNMLGMHAILYLSKEWKTKIITHLQAHIRNPGNRGADDGIVSMMEGNIILGARRPFFYQNDGHSEVATQTPLGL